MHDEAKKLYRSGTPLADVAKQFNTPYSTVKTWKRREQWDSDSFVDSKKDSKPKKVSTLKPARVTKKPKPGTAPYQPRNQEAVIHGLFARYLPNETRDIMDQMKDRKPIDILFDQIQLAYAAIIRAQKLMYVKNQKDMTKLVSSESSGAGGDSTGYLIQLPWDKQASFLTAQAKAQASLNNMIKQYEEMSHYELAAEEQRAKIDQIKANTARLSDGDEDEDDGVIINYGPRDLHRGSGDPEANAGVPGQ